MTSRKIINQQQYQTLKSDIAKILGQAKAQIQELANAILAESYWKIGQRISQENLSENANYANLTLQDLENDLKIDKKTLGQAIRLFDTYPNGLKQNLSWSHYRQLITIKDEKSRVILAKKAEEQNLSVRQLESSIKDLNSPSTTSAKSSKTKKIKRPTDPSYLYKAKIIDVVDGDTLILHIDLGFEVIKRQRVRLTQINAPEMKTKAGQESFRYLRDLCARIDEVAIKTNKVDIYGRFLGDIFYLEGRQKLGTTQGDIFNNGLYLNQKLVEEGMVFLA